MDLSHAQKPNNPNKKKKNLIQPVLRPSFKRPMINDIIYEINNILSVGSSKHSKMKSIILKGLSGGNLFVKKVFILQSISVLLFVVILFFIICS